MNAEVKFVAMTVVLDYCICLDGRDDAVDRAYSLFLTLLFYSRTNDRFAFRQTSSHPLIFLFFQERTPSGGSYTFTPDF